MLLPFRASSVLVPLLLCACARGAPPVPPVPEPVPEPIPKFVFDHAVVWTARAEVPIAAEGTARAVEQAFTPLIVLEADEEGVRVRCARCRPEVEGRVGWADVVYDPMEPADAAAGDLGTFALAVHAAASRRDLDALFPVLASEFTYGFVGPQGRSEALEVWRAEGFRLLDRVPFLLEQGLVTRDGRIWAAPPAHVEAADFRGTRLGFRRTGSGTWEWVFLIEGLLGG